MGLIRKYNEFVSKHKLFAFREVLLFMIITLAIHYAYRYWAQDLRYAPVPKTMFMLEEHMTQTLYVHSKWIIIRIPFLDIIYVDDAERVIGFASNGYTGINHSCSGFKQMLQLILLFLLYPGPWKHKLWYIPMGVVVIYIVNVIRIVTLCIVMNYNPGYFEFTHDYIVRPFFYIVIFALWVIWVEKVYTRRIKGEDIQT